MQLIIKGRLKRQVKTLEEASTLFQAARDKAMRAGERGADFPNGHVINGTTVYTVSFNGRVWCNDTLVIEATGASDTVATTKAHALTILATFSNKSKVADLYDDSEALRDALAFVFGADFEFPNVSHLTIAQVIARLPA